MHRVVFDTVVFVRALINPYSRCGRLVFVHSAEYHLVVSPPVLEEILEVLQRPELTTKFKSLAAMDIGAVLDCFSRAEVVEIPTVPRVVRDPKDDKFLATALAAGCAYLVSEDKDLLVLGSHAGVTILDTAAFLDLLERHAEDPA